VQFQKLLFLFSQRQKKAEYDFIPYKYGCYSFSAKADLTAMANKGTITELDTSLRCNDRTNYISALTETDRKLLVELKGVYGQMSPDRLLKHTYNNYPYWATKSTLAESILSLDELTKVFNARTVINDTILFTIGYEGVSLEGYLNRLIRNDVKVLVDVRKNALSMKFGFSKGQLKRYCESVGIEYVHFPDVGIDSDKRQELNNQSDYDALFETYRETNLNLTISTQKIILDILQKNKRIALTCFEANICQCHRKYLSEAICQLPGFQYELKHI
jgi:uncharacterized protein (DUF488 family)